MSTSINHKLTEVDDNLLRERGPKCLVHESLRARKDFWCEDCEKFVCKLCDEVDPTHNHSLQTVNDKAEEIRQRFEAEGKAKVDAFK